MYLYLILNLASISIPLAYSFNSKMRFIQYWKSVLLSLSIMATIFLIWDAIFTTNGVWGFNPDYHLPFTLLEMPIEEWLFFFCIPYASIFIHYALAHFKPKLVLSPSVTKLITVFAIAILLPTLYFHHEKDYTFVNFTLLVIVLITGLVTGLQHLQRFYIAFLIILIPFFIVNGILTGTGLEEPVVWYNNAENLGIRLGTIPVEDIGYAFTLLFGNVLLIERFKS